MNQEEKTRTYQHFISLATNTVKQAIQEDTNGNYSTAISLYVTSTVQYMDALKYVDDEDFKKRVKVEVSKYLQRAQDLRVIQKEEALKSQQQLITNNNDQALQQQLYQIQHQKETLHQQKEELKQQLHTPVPIQAPSPQHKPHSFIKNVGAIFHRGQHNQPSQQNQTPQNKQTSQIISPPTTNKSVSKKESKKSKKQKKARKGDDSEEESEKEEESEEEEEEEEEESDEEGNEQVEQLVNEVEKEERRSKRSEKKQEDEEKEEKEEKEEEEEYEVPDEETLKKMDKMLVDEEKRIREELKVTSATDDQIANKIAAFGSMGLGLDDGKDELDDDDEVLKDLIRESRIESLSNNQRLTKLDSNEKKKKKARK